MLKLEMAAAIRAAGWYATLEVPAEDGSWRADVMASSVDGTQRMAWEAQLSPITLDDIAGRTDRYVDDGIRVCWVSPHEQAPPWISTVPAVRVRSPKERDQDWVVDDGLAGFDFAAGGWVFREAPLSQFVRWALHGQLVPTPVLPRYRRVYRVIDGKRRRFRRSQWWTSLQSVGAQKKHEAMRQRQEAAKAEREAREEEAERRQRALEEQERARRAERLSVCASSRRRRPAPAGRRSTDSGRRRLRSGRGKERRRRRGSPRNRPNGRKFSGRCW
jgi:hypothetical protein